MRRESTDVELDIPRSTHSRNEAFKLGSGRPLDTDRTDRKEPLMSNTVRFHRVLRAAPEKVYRAFIDADAMAKWLPPNGFTARVHHMDAKVGGTYKMSFTNFTTGRSHSFGGKYLELVPHERIRHTDKFRSEEHTSELQSHHDL